MCCLGDVTSYVADAGLYVCCAIWQGCEIRRRNCQAPATARCYGGGVAFAAENNGNGLPRFHAGGGAGELQITAFFGGVNHIVAGKYIDGDSDGGEIDGDRMANAGCRSGGVGACNRNIDRPRKPVSDIPNRNAHAPGAVG